jgi:hypothetical protein
MVGTAHHIWLAVWGRFGEMAATSSDKEQKPPKGTADSVTPREIALGRDPYFKSLA